MPFQLRHELMNNGGMPFPNHGQTVRPACPARWNSEFECTPQTQSSKRHWEYRSLFDCAAPDQCPTRRTPQSRIVSSRELLHSLRMHDSQQIICSRTGTMYQQQPRALSVLHMRDSAEQRLVFLGHNLQLPPYKFWMSDGCSQHLDPLSIHRDPRPTPHNRFRIAQPGNSFQLVTCLWPLTCRIPHFRLTSMNYDLRPELCLKCHIDWSNTLWKCDRVCVIVENHEPFTCLEGLLCRCQSSIVRPLVPRLRLGEFGPRPLWHPPKGTRMEIRRTSAQMGPPGHHLPLASNLPTWLHDMKSYALTPSIEVIVALGLISVSPSWT